MVVQRMQGYVSLDDPQRHPTEDRFIPSEPDDAEIGVVSLDD
jgi:hypothetical protein